MDLKGSKTEKNLMAAFAGESQARNKYTYYASQAKKEGFVQISRIFEETANNEKEHAKLWFKALHGEKIPDTLTNLQDAADGENYEWTDMYAQFAREAKEEGFAKIAASFHNIAEIEKTHGDRFGRFADLLEQNKLFLSDVECGWMCLNCGYITNTKGAPEICPVCSHDQGFFIRLEMAPYCG